MSIVLSLCQCWKYQDINCGRCYTDETTSSTCCHLLFNRIKHASQMAKKKIMVNFWRSLKSILLVQKSDFLVDERMPGESTVAVFLGHISNFWVIFMATWQLNLKSLETCVIQARMVRLSGQKRVMTANTN